MEFQRVVFARNHRPFSYVIRIATVSLYSHCAVVLDNGDILEARGGHGVIITPRAEFYDRYTEVVEMWMPVVDKDAAMAFWMSQLGKGYDLDMAFGWLFRQHHWQDPDKWSCSEILAAGGGIFADGARVTPQDILLTCRKEPVVMVGSKLMILEQV